MEIYILYTIVLPSNNKQHTHTIIFINIGEKISSTKLGQNQHRIS